MVSVVAGSIGKDWGAARRARALNHMSKKKRRVYMSSFHNGNRAFLHVNPTCPFTTHLENRTWTEQVTNRPRGFTASDSVTDGGGG